MALPGGKEQLRRRLYLAAHQEVAEVVKALPAQLKAHARGLPVIYEMVPHRDDVARGIATDTLGLFSGTSMADGLEATAPAPTEIILYMENIWDYAGRRSADFREEIRRTYLHELGHYLGLDEDDLFFRDLD